MTSYLASIVGRERTARGVERTSGAQTAPTAERTDPIVPRLASTYEPWTSSLADDAPTTSDAEMEPPRPVRRSIDSTDEPAASSQRGVSAADRAGAADVLPASRAAIPAESTEPPRHDDDRRGDTSLHEGIVERVVAHEVRERVVSLQHAERPTQTKDRRAVVPRVEPTASEAAQAEARDEPARAVHAHTVVPRAAVPVPTATYRGEPRRPDASVLGKAPPEGDQPAVVVTIGRIDVRAVTTASAAAGARLPRETRSMMSLEEYLQQRARGSR